VELFNQNSISVATLRSYCYNIDNEISISIESLFVENKQKGEELSLDKVMKNHYLFVKRLLLLPLSEEHV
jgi:hypothetical protein